MLDYNSFPVRTWTGEIKEVKKITFFPELNPKTGEIFYKIEGQIGNGSFMVRYYKDKERGLEEYNKLLNQLVDFQANNLRNYEG